MIYVCIVDRDNNYDYVVITTMQDILTCFSLLLLHICMHTCSWLYACMHVPVQCKHIAIWNFEMQLRKTAILTWRVLCTEPYHLQVEGFGYMMRLFHLTLAIKLLVCTYCQII